MTKTVRKKNDKKNNKNNNNNSNNNKINNNDNNNNNNNNNISIAWWKTFSNNLWRYVHHNYCFGSIFSCQSMIKKFCCRFLFYDLYFGFYSWNASWNIYHSSKHLCIHYDSLLEQHFYSNPLHFSVHYYHIIVKYFLWCIP